MQLLTNLPLVISASRTKDMVHRSPALLADLLLGKAPCRWGPHSPPGQIDPETIHTVVLWTKDPGNLISHNGLRQSLMKLHDGYNVQIAVQVTATGLGGSFLEPGIPTWQEVHGILEKLFSEGWIDPRVVVYRYDPFLTVRTGNGLTLSNANLEVFKEITQAFLRLDLPRVTTSRADAVSYPKVLNRVRSYGLEWDFIEDDRAVTLCRQMSEFCKGKGADFSICCEPFDESITGKWGCIDAHWMNRVKGDDNPATESLHNKIGKQRPACRCTYSRDIGYSTGSATCFSGGYGCLYCYSQGNANLPDRDFIFKEIEEFNLNPVGYLKSRGLSESLLIDV